jgi:hypothetical protein
VAFVKLSFLRERLSSVRLFGSSTLIVGKIFKAPFGGRGATLEISPAQRAG